MELEVEVMDQSQIFPAHLRAMTFLHQEVQPLIPDRPEEDAGWALDLLKAGNGICDDALSNERLIAEIAGKSYGNFNENVSGLWGKDESWQAELGEPARKMHIM